MNATFTEITPMREVTRKGDVYVCGQMTRQCRTCGARIAATAAIRIIGPVPQAGTYCAQCHPEARLACLRHIARERVTARYLAWLARPRWNR